MTDEPIESIPGYSGLVRIGMGASGVVYRARQAAFDRDVAVKVLSGDFDESARRRFLREARLTGRLTGHPNVVTALDAGTTAGGHPYLAMDLFERGSLQDRLSDSGPLPAAEAAVIGAKIAAALADAHALGMVHRDVKPSNILVSRFGEPALADFGVAVVPEGTAVTMFNAYTPHHAAPEVLVGSDADALSDVYSLGSTLYHLLTGRPPFAGQDDGADLSALLHRIVTTPAPPLECPELPGLAEVVTRTLAKDPADRPESAAALAAELRTLAGAGPRLSGTALTMPPLTASDPTHPAQAADAGPAFAGAPGVDAAAVGPHGTVVGERGAGEATVSLEGSQDTGGPQVSAGSGGAVGSQGSGGFGAAAGLRGRADFGGVLGSQGPAGFGAAGSQASAGSGAALGPQGPAGFGATAGPAGPADYPPAPGFAAAHPSTPEPDPRRSAAGFEAPPIELPRLATAPQPVEPDTAERHRRRRPVIISASAAAAVVVAIGAIALSQGSSSPSKTAGGGPRSGAAMGADGDTASGQPTDRPVGQDVNAGGPMPSAGSSQSSVPGGSPAAQQGVPGSSGPTGNAHGSSAPPATSAPGTTAQPTGGHPTSTAGAPGTTAPPPSSTPPPSTKPPSTSTSSKNMSCTGWHITHVVADDGSGYAKTGTFDMRSGPYSACSAVGKFTTGQHMYIWCHTTNGYGNVWIYGRIDGTSTPAWQSIANFKSGVTLGPAC